MPKLGVQASLVPPCHNFHKTINIIPTINARERKRENLAPPAGPRLPQLRASSQHSKKLKKHSTSSSNLQGTYPPPPRRSQSPKNLCQDKRLAWGILPNTLPKRLAFHAIELKKPNQLHSSIIEQKTFYGNGIQDKKNFRTLKGRPGLPIRKPSSSTFCLHSDFLPWAIRQENRVSSEVWGPQKAP